MGARFPCLTGGGIVGDSARLLVFLCGLIMAASAFLGTTSVARAHASLLRSTPVEGAVVQAAPAELLLGFSETVAPLVTELIGPDGTKTRLTAKANGADLAIAWPGWKAEGTYLLSWRVVSSDGHPVAGVLSFSVGNPSVTPPAAPELNDTSMRLAIWSAKLVLYLGLFLGVGGAFALAWLMPGKHSGVGVIGALLVAGLVAAPVSFGLQGLDALGAPLALFGQGMGWQAAAATSYAFTAAIAFIALSLALLALASDASLARWLSLAGLVGVGTALAASGHASAATPQWLTRPMVFVHGTGIAFWAGALLPLAFCWREGGESAELALRRFSVAIPYVVAALVAAGLVLTVIQVEAVPALWHTGYGLLLSAKLVLAFALLALAGFNRWQLTKPALAEQRGAQRLLVRSILVETLLMVAILGLVAGFRFTPPPRVLAIETAAPAAIHIHTPEAMADFALSPGHAGAVSASIMVMTGDFGPLDARGVVLRLSQSGSTEIKADAYKPGDGTWRIDSLDLPAPGIWAVAIDIDMAEGQVVTLDGAVAIRPATGW
ncbi:copper resistance protein CopC [Aminobacter sp. Y103A]|jgi:copper transport protein|uniref:copper resistance CopC/CopD family protein n=1 Tax=Aminobacter sp. Y103A TaxID=1870862 RepID=UPI0025739CCC|nr:copper resistance protein CopC [Aminobacter sp. SS-2016]BBD40408.1 copper resistance protein CopC [Aminobacter sp. SS-2016]